VTSDIRTFEQTLQHGNFIVRDHHVHGVRTLPGVTLLDMIHRLAPACVGGEAFELRRVVFQQPIVTSEAFDQTIVVTFGARGGHWSVTVRSYRSRDGRRLDERTAENMSCTLHLVPAGATPGAVLDVAAFLATAQQRVDMADIYEFARRVDIRHEVFMKTLGTVYARGSEELMRIRLSDEAERFRDRFRAHPALLDGSTFAGQSIRVWRPAAVTDDTPYIPFSIDRFRLYRPLPREIYTYSNHATLWAALDGPPPDVSMADITILDAEGQPLAEFSRFAMKRIRSASLIHALVSEAGGGRAAHSPRAPAPTTEAAPVSQPGVQSVAAHLQARVAEVLGRTPQEISLEDNFYDLGMDSTQLLGLTRDVESALGQELYPTLLFEHSNIERLAAYLAGNFDVARLFAPAARAGEGPSAPPPVDDRADDRTLLFTPQWSDAPVPKALDGIVLRRHVLWIGGAAGAAHDAALHAAFGSEPALGTLRCLTAETSPSPPAIEALLADVIGELRALASARVGEEQLVQIVAEGSGGQGWATLFAGSLHTLVLEHPRVRAQLVLVDDLPHQAKPDVVRLLAQEAAASRPGATLIAHTANTGRRRVRTLRETALQAEDPHADPYRREGVYVIAGGFGGLGLLLGEHLAGNGRRPRLALLGRSGPDAAAQARIDRLEKQGARVLSLSVDITDAEAVESAFARIRRELGPVNGVVHSAGSIHDQALARKDPATIGRVARPKIAGLANLDKASADDRLDFLVAFSSLSGITGNIGQVDYAAANAFMDGFMLRREASVAQGSRHGRSLALDWPLWAEGGMSIGVERGIYESAGLRVLPTTAGLAVLDSALRSRLPQVVVTHGVPSRIRGLLARQLGDHGTASPSSPANDEPAPPVRIMAPALHLNDDDEIAVVGLAGRYPGARDIAAFARQLRAGHDAVTRLPVERWAGHDFGYALEDIYPHGGFIDGIDEFDALFFGLPPLRARALDPQARLFLQAAWEACEDAGHPLDRKGQHYRAGGEQSVGVFVGAFWSHYELFGAESSLRGTPASLGTSLSAISNMTSYCLNLHGPSIALDTMCSSSLTSVHLACESLRRSECHFAIAGGVNLTTHPHKLLFLKENHFLSSHGACRSFGEGGDGYVPAEGVGAVLLTTLSRARRLGYPIRGVIKGSAINHGGRTAGGTVPNPVAQAEVIADALATAGVNPRSISCVEAHGTGTALGDPIEIQGLASAFGRSTPDRQFCAIGSSKSNIGHAEAAAGIAGLTKLLLQLEHRELFPSLHADRLNPLIPFADTPFRVQSALAPWERPVLPSPSGPAPQPRRALISAFGASGSNASLVLEEAGDAPDAPRHAPRRQVAIVLSARDEVRLGEVVQRLLDRLQDGTLSDHDLPAIAFTLQVGREAMDERLAFAADSLADVVRRLHDVRDGRDDGGAIHRGRVQRNQPAGARWASDASREAELSSWIESGAMEALAARWVEGMPIDWPRLYPHGTPRRLHLPTYPFARERHWVPAPSAVPPTVPAPATASPEPAPPRLRAAATASPLPEMPERKTRKVQLAALDDRPTAVGIAPVTAPAAPAAPAAADAPHADPAEEARIREVLMRTLCATLFMDAADIGEDVSFLDLGMDSIIAVQWIKAVNAELGTEMKATVLYDHSTVAALARHLLLMSKTEATPAAEDETTSVDTDPGLPPSTAAEPDALRRSLRESLAAVLFMDAADLDDDSVFTDFGLDSIIAVQWIKAVNAAHGTQLKATVLYEQPTLRALATHLQAVLDAPAAIDDSGATASRWGDDLAYALTGCENVEINVVELAPGRCLERIAAGRGTPVILLSPMGALATVWMHQLRALSRAGYRAFVFHYPGHGRSDFGMERPGFAEIAEAVLRALPAEEEQTRFHLVGWSMGALIAQQVARAEPARVRSLTLVSAPAHVTDGPSADSTVTVLGHLASDFAAHVPESAQGTPESAFEFIRAPLKLDAAMPYLEETLGFDYGSTASITTETLVLFGAHDQVIAPEHGLLLASEIAHSRYCRHDSGGHYLPLQNAEWFNERLLQFLRETERSRHAGRVAGAAVDGQPA